MKKIILLLLLVFSTFSLTACGGLKTVKPNGPVEAELVDLNGYADETIDITFWHIFGQDKKAAIDSMAAEFSKYMKDKYKINVTVNSISQSNYSTLLDKTNKAIAKGTKDGLPNIVIGYPDHFAGYISSHSILSLKKYIESEEYGVDMSDYIQAYVDENNQFGGTPFSLPFSKSAEILCYNKSIVDGYNAGVTEEEKIKIPYDRALTWTELTKIWGKIKDYNQNSAQLQYLLNYDSSDNLFINFARQLNAKYTNAAGEVLVKDGTTTTMVKLIQNYISNKYLSIPINYEDTANYGSAYFQQQKMLFTIGSTAGSTYNIPKKLDPSNGINYLFECGFGWVPQFETGADGQAATKSVVQQGPNICVLNAGTSEENLISWLFIKYMTAMDEYVGFDEQGNPLETANGVANSKGFVEGQDNSARFAIASGYFPVTEKAYQSTLYQSYVGIAKKYFIEYGEDKTKLSEEETAKLALSTVAYIGYLQRDYYKFDPAFRSSTKVGFFGSAQIRAEAGNLINKIAKDTNYDAALALSEMYDKCKLK